MPGVKYIGPLLDCSGYSEAARNYVLALHQAGYPITVSPITFEKTRPNLGKEGEILYSLINREINYDKVIVHCTPDLWANFTRSEQGKYIIGLTVWETDKLHPLWTQCCNRVNEVWLPCQWNIDVFRKSGVEVPLYKVPHSLPRIDIDSVPIYNVSGVEPGDFVFYSIFQWQERKNPLSLLAAYYSAFSGIDDVILVIKSYKQDMERDRELIKNTVLEFKKYVRLDHYPKISLVPGPLSTTSMFSLHKSCDAFVLLQRSEGWGLPHFESAFCGKPIITPGYGGQLEFLNEENSYLVNYTECPVMGMEWSPYYLGDQMWCEADLKDAMEKMKHVYRNRDEAAKKGLLAQKQIRENFSAEKVGKIMSDRLLAIG